MKRIPKTSFLVKVLLSLYFLMLLSLGAQGQNTFLYTNDNIDQNTVTAFFVTADGALTEVGAFSTGGAGNNCGLYVSNRVAVSNAGNLLFASNSLSNDVSVFSINSNNGSLTFVGRFPTGGQAGDCTDDISGISLTVTPDSRFLMAGNAGSNDVTIFSISADGSLTAISGSPFAAGGAPDGMKISANGTFLGVGLTQPVGVLSISQSGVLTPAPGSPFQGSGADAGVDIKCSGNQLFAGNGTTGTTVIDVFDLPATGTLSPIAGSPFQPGVGVNSNGVLLSPHGQFLFVSNQGTGTGDDTITVFKVAANGSLTLVSGSPYAVGSGGATPSLMATDQAGRFLFVANFPTTGGARDFSGARGTTTPGTPPASIGVFLVASDGSLTPVGTPTTVPGSSLEALTAFPAPVCGVPVPLIQQPLVPDSAAPGDPGFTLTVNGTGFVSGVVIKWNGGALPTTVVSDNQVIATVPAADIAAPGTASVTVTNPTGSTSNAAFFSVTTPTESVVFSGSPVVVGSYPQGVIVADFNRDGVQDVAVVNTCGTDPSCQSFSPGTVSILLGNGDGTFSTKSVVTVGVLPVTAAVGDFNEDGIPDLIVVNSDIPGGGTYSILLGNGDGTFSSAAPVPIGLDPLSVVTADFNGDGNLDFVITDTGSNTIAGCLGNGDGTFTPQRCFGMVVGNAPASIATGDFNGDGIPDLAVANENDSDVAILLGNGDATFILVGTIPVDSHPLSIVAADLNRDGKLDLAIANYDSNTVSVRLGNGDGTFQNQVTYSTGLNPFTLVAGDLNGDGIVDLAVTNFTASSLSVLLGNGDGTFQTSRPIAAGSIQAGLAVGDFNGDGRLDLAAALTTQNTLSILLQSPVATVNPPGLDFGSQTVNTTSSPMTVQLSNTGTANLNISGISISGANGSDFVETNDCPVSLPFTSPGNSCTIQVTFTPSTTGIRTATLSIADNAAGSPQAVSLTGMGVNPVQPPPTCTLQVQSTADPLSIAVTTSCSSSGTITATTIDWGDGKQTPATSGAHTYDNPGTYIVTVTATDNLNQVGTASQPVTLTLPPPPVFPGQDTSVVFTPPPGTLTYSCPSGIGPNGPISDLRTVGITCTGSQPVQNGQVTLTIHTTGTGLARLERRASPLSGSLAFWMPFPAIVLLGSGLTRRRPSRNLLRRYVTLGLLLVLLLISTSCGGGFTVPTQPPPSGPVTDAGIYHLTATGTDSTGFVQISLIVPLNVASN